MAGGKPDHHMTSNSCRAPPVASLQKAGSSVCREADKDASDVSLSPARRGGGWLISTHRAERNFLNRTKVSSPHQP